jgi:hypothetical protein
MGGSPPRLKPVILSLSVLKEYSLLRALISGGVGGRGPPPKTSNICLILLSSCPSHREIQLLLFAPAYAAAAIIVQICHNVTYSQSECSI